MDLCERDHEVDPAPYVGPRPYRVSEAAVFGGRNHEARAVAALWTEGSVTVAHGYAGVGKTSLLQAGVIPLVDPAAFDVLPVGRVTAGTPTLPPALLGSNPYTLALLASWSPAESPARLSKMTISEFLERRTAAPRRPVLAAIDQFEELYRGSQGRLDDRHHFLDELAEALERHFHLHVLIVVRDGVPADLSVLARTGAHASVRVSGLDRDCALDAIRRPALGAGRRLAAGAAEELVDGLLNVDGDSIGAALRGITSRDATVLPAYLQAACAWLWQALPPDLPVVSALDVRQYLDEDLCLAALIRRALVAILQRYDLRPTQLAPWLTQAFVSGAGTSPAVVEAAADDQPLRSLLRALEDYYVVRSDAAAGALSYQLPSRRLVKPLQLAVQSILTVPLASIAAEPVVDRLTDAAHALSDGDLDVAERQATATLGLSARPDARRRAQADLLLGNIAYERGDFARSRRFYLDAAESFEVEQDDAAVGDLLAAVGRLQLLDGDTAGAVATLQSALSRLPADGTVKLELARAFVHSGEPRAAMAVLESASMARADLGRNETRLLRGEILSDLGEASAALRDLESAHYREHPAATAARALSPARLGRFADAEEGIEQALEMSRDNGPVLLRAAQILMLRGDAAAAAGLALDAINAKEARLTEYQRRQADLLRRAS
jgi:tetratricopeptide (TPR) repeat protein